MKDAERRVFFGRLDFTVFCLFIVYFPFSYFSHFFVGILIKIVKRGVLLNGNGW